MKGSMRHNPLVDDDDAPVFEASTKETPPETPAPRAVAVLRTDISDLRTEIKTDFSGLKLATERRAMWARLERVMLGLAVAIACYLTERLVARTEILLQQRAAPVAPAEPVPRFER